MRAALGKALASHELRPKEKRLIGGQPYFHRRLVERDRAEVAELAMRAHREHVQEGPTHAAETVRLDPCVDAEVFLSTAFVILDSVACTPGDDDQQREPEN